MLYRICVFISKILFRLFYKINIEKPLQLDENQGYIICSNHIHLFDPVLIACFTNRQIHYMCKKEAFDNKPLGFILKKIGTFPVDREKPDMASIRTAVNILKDKKVLGIFPEGTRSKDGKLGKFKNGAALIALKGDTPIIPVKIETSYKLFSKIKLTFGNPIIYVGKNRDELTEIMRKAISEL